MKDMSRKQDVENIIEIDHETLKDVIRISYEHMQSTMVVGRTGIGKSYCIREASKDLAKELNLKFTEDERYINNPEYFCLIDRRLSMMESSDIQGIPFVFAIIADRSVEDHPLSTIPIQNIHRVTNEPNRYEVMGYKTVWVKPTFLPIRGHGLIFLDEITLAPPLLQSSAYSLIYDRKVADYTLPEGYLVIGASNVHEDQAYTHTMAGPLRNRFIWYKLGIPDVKQYVDWGTQVKPEEDLPLDNRIIAYLLSRGNHHLFNFSRDNADMAFPTPRCIRGDSKILMSNLSLKEIKDIEIGDEIIGYKNDSFVRAKVLCKFKKEINNIFEINSNINSLYCSGEHKFLTDNSYVQAKDLYKIKPTEIYRCNYGVLEKENKDKNIRFKSNSTKLFSSSNRRRRKYISNKEESERQNLLRTSNINIKHISPIQRLLRENKLKMEKGKEKTHKTKMARQICNNYLRLRNDRNTKSIDSISRNKETSSIIDERIYQRKNKAKVRKSILQERNFESQIERFDPNDKIDKLKTEREAISIRKTNNKEVFYDITTTSGNYIANGFIVHNSWFYTSKLIKGIKNQRLIRILASSSVGSGEAHEFLAFLSLEHKLKPVEYYFRNPTTCELPEENMSLKYFLLGMVVEYYATKAKDYKTEKKKLDILDRFIKIINRLDPEFTVLAVKMTRGLDPTLRDNMYKLEGVDDLIERLSKYFS